MDYKKSICTLVNKMSNQRILKHLYGIVVHIWCREEIYEEQYQQNMKRKEK
jgi:hypothetical protein